MDEGKIAILLAAYNGGRFLKQQIESVLRQSFSNWHLYIHDDGSTDSTPAIIAEYSARYPELISAIAGPPSGGAKNNYFYLMKKVEAPYYMFCDQDDFWLPDKVNKTFSAMEELERSGDSALPLLVFSDLSVVDENLDVIAERMSEYQILPPNRTGFGNLLVQNVITGCAVMINRKLRNMAITEADCDNIIMHDWWCALIAARFGRIAFVNEALTLYRQHGDNCVGAKAVHNPLYLLNHLFEGNDSKESLRKTRIQSGEFSAVFKEPEDSVAKRYSLLGESGKLKRIEFYCSNHLTKAGFQRNLGLLLFG